MMTDKRKIVLEASILSADFARLGEDAERAEAAGVDAIQIDIMDGSFVPPITFGPGVVRALKRHVDLPLDVHLMIVEPERHLDAFAEAGADRIIVHAEATVHIHRALQLIHEHGIDAGVTISPGTSLTAIEEVLDMVDVVQIMTVNPGWGGQELIESQYDKIRRLRERLEGLSRWVPIAVDGGVDTTTGPRLVEAGATVMVSGSAIYNERASVAENVSSLRESWRGIFWSS